MRIRPLRLAAAGLAASSLLLLTACNDDGGAEGKKGSAATPEPPRPMSAQQAKSVLVGEQDLSDGWKLQKDVVVDVNDPSQNVLDKAEPAKCQILADVLNTGRLLTDFKITKQVVFSDRSDGSSIAQDVSGYQRPAEAERGMKSLAAAVKGCASFSATYEERKVKVTVAGFDVPALGEEKVSYRLKIDDATKDQVLDYDVVSVRSGANISTLYNNWGEDGERGEKAFDRAVHKAAATLDKVAAEAKK
ncbi:hypothetical protein GCM10010329_74460 [Streptomyces spiroverticillatus]|uniref:Lipoprotein n=1 Tax=Streptomyces finlayi TaxID=67296 RepID=A0A918X6N3_9ACTN|nr:hypothetical protein [Streptomyces finlayi]GHA40468.1 hypothetical protein GCM10010329_74460 [Streptomyces spiroverticillatus]GHD15470.1 hypothetical protein GCM10010334_75610 [Streptomyces finlayi]